MSDYVPYQERVRRAERESAGAAADAAADHKGQLARVTSALERLGSRDTSVYLEILRPAKGLRRMFNKDAVITRRGLAGGPDFVIGEVLEAYRIPGAVIRSYRDAMDQTFAAMLTPTGRVWLHTGEGVTENTWQLLASSEQSLDSLAVGDLQRIANHLERLHHRGHRPG